MVSDVLDWLFGGSSDDARTFGARRSPRWPAVRKAWLRAHPFCAACGTFDNLAVHHKLPFHLFPELELDAGNFITLCESDSHNCHLLFGHALNWARYNQQVVEDAAACLAMLVRAVDGRQHG